MAETRVDEGKATRRARKWRASLFAFAGASAGIIATLAAVPAAAGFVRDSWCWAFGCSAPLPQPKPPEPKAPAPAAPSPERARPRNPNNACYFNYMLLGTRANANMGLVTLPPGEREVLTLIMMDCNPITGEFDLRRKGSGIWGVHFADSHLFDGALHLTFNHWVDNHPIHCSFDSDRRSSVRTFEGRLSCEDVNLNTYRPRATSRNEQVTVALYECDDVCRDVLMRGEFENNGHGPQEWLKGVGEPAN